MLPGCGRLGGMGKTTSFSLRGYFSYARPPGHVPALDGLRGLAILMVVLHHAAVPILAAHRAEFGPWLGLLLNGWLGVDLFFVLSGFLIAHHIGNRYLDSGGFRWKNYVMRRILRIVPAYYGVLLLIVLGAFPHFEMHGGDQNLGWRIAYHLLFLQDYLPPDIQLSFWSLGVEEKFYMLAPLLLLGLAGMKKPWQKYALLSVLLAYAPLARWLTFLSYQMHGAPITADQLFFIFRMPFHLAWDGLVAGVFCACLVRDKKFMAAARKNSLPDVMFWFGWAVVALLMCAGTVSIVWQASLSALGFALVMLGALCGAKTASFLSGRILFFFALVSYSLYLTHNLLFDAVALGMDALVDFSGYAPFTQFAIFLPVYLLICTGVGAMFFFALEKPFLILRDRLR